MAYREARHLCTTACAYARRKASARLDGGGKRVAGAEHVPCATAGRQGALDSAMAEVQEALSLPRLPKRIECYDISNIQGTDSVGSMVVFQNGAPRKEHYRRFKIKSVEGPDDFASMRESVAPTLRSNGGVHAVRGRGNPWCAAQRCARGR